MLGNNARFKDLQTKLHLQRPKTVVSTFHFQFNKHFQCHLTKERCLILWKCALSILKSNFYYKNPFRAWNQLLRIKDQGLSNCLGKPAFRCSTGPVSFQSYSESEIVHSLRLNSHSAQLCKCMIIVPHTSDFNPIYVTHLNYSLPGLTTAKFETENHCICSCKFFKFVPHNFRKTGPTAMVLKLYYLGCFQLKYNTFL